MDKYLSRLFLLILFAYLMLATALLYWQVISAPTLLVRPDNPRLYEQGLDELSDPE